MKQLAEPLRVRATGELVGAPFGFANTFLSMFAELQPTHVIVALDKGSVTFRNKIAASYKATRARMPDEERQEFNRQMDRSRQVIETVGIPMIDKDNYEADDLMGTLAAQAAAGPEPAWAEAGIGAGIGAGIDAGSEDSLGAAVERHLAAYFRAHKGRLPADGLYERILYEVERPLIELSLAATRGNQIRAAKLLGLNRNTLRKKIRDLNIQVIRGFK